MIPTSDLRLPTLRSCRRRAFTLLEVVLVLAILAAIAAFTWPALEHSFASQRLQSGGDEIRTAWTRARVEAMSSGLPMVFSCQRETGTYLMETYEGPDAELEAATTPAFDATASTALPVTSSQSNGETYAPGQRQLPEDLVVAAVNASADVRGIYLLQASAASDQPSSSAQTSMDTGMSGTSGDGAIFFYPDGTTSDATLVLRSDAGLFLRLDLRGLTGVITVSDVLDESELGEMP